MTLLLSVVLGLVPLLGIAWAVSQGAIATVDGLFMSLIMLTLSGILFLNALLDVKMRRRSKHAPPAQKTS